MLKFIFRKMLNKKWMTISLLVGNLLMVAIAAAVPMYSQAVLSCTSRLSAVARSTESRAASVAVAILVSHDEYVIISL